MLRILAILFLTIVYVWGEYRIVKMVPFGDGNLKIPRRNFIFKDNSTLQVAQNTPKIVRIVINIQPKSTFDIIKEKENLYILIKPAQQEDKEPPQKPMPLDSKNTPKPSQTRKQNKRK